MIRLKGLLSVVDRCMEKAAKLSKDDIDDVNTFYNNIVLPTKQEFGGVPGRDYDPKYYVKDFPKKVGTRYFDGLNASGYASPRDVFNTVHLQSTVGGPSVFVHELTHLQNRDAPFFLRRLPIFRNYAPVAHAGASPQEDRTLTRAYHFGPSALQAGYGKKHRDVKHGLMEQATTNREYRYKIWKDLSKQLGHPATYDEFKQHVRSMPQNEILSIWQNPVNPYQTNAINSRVRDNPERKRLLYERDHLPRPPKEYDKWVVYRGNPNQFKDEVWYKDNPELFDSIIRDHRYTKQYNEAMETYNKELQAYEQAKANQPKPTLMGRFRQVVGLDPTSPKLPPKPIKPYFQTFGFNPYYEVNRSNYQKAEKAISDFDKAHVGDPEAIRRAWLEVAHNQPQQPSALGQPSRFGGAKAASAIPIFRPTQYNSLKGHPMTPYASAFIKRACERKFDKHELLSAMQKLIMTKQAQQKGQTRQGLMNRMRAGLTTGLGHFLGGASTNGLPKSVTGTWTTPPSVDFRKAFPSAAGKFPAAPLPGGILGTGAATTPYLRPGFAGGMFDGTTGKEVSDSNGNPVTGDGAKDSTHYTTPKSWLERLREVGRPTTDLAGRPLSNNTNGVQKATASLGQTDTTQGGGLQHPNAQSGWQDLLSQWRARRGGDGSVRTPPPDPNTARGWDQILEGWRSRRNGGRFMPPPGRTMEWRHEWDRPGDTMLLRGPVPRFM